MFGLWNIPICAFHALYITNPVNHSVTAGQSVKFSKNYSCLDCQQHCCIFACQINPKQLIASSFVDNPPAESHGGCHNESFIWWSELLACYSWSYTQVYSSALLKCYMYHYLSHWQHCWRITCQPFLCLGSSILIREDLSRTRASEARLVVYTGFWLNWKSSFLYLPTEYKNIQERYQMTFLRMTWRNQIQRKFYVKPVFMHARASKAPYHRKRVNRRWLQHHHLVRNHISILKHIIFELSVVWKCDIKG